MRKYPRVVDGPRKHSSPGVPKRHLVLRARLQEADLVEIRDRRADRLMTSLEGASGPDTISTPSVIAEQVRAGNSQVPLQQIAAVEARQQGDRGEVVAGVRRRSRASGAARDRCSSSASRSRSTHSRKTLGSMRGMSTVVPPITSAGKRLAICPALWMRERVELDHVLVHVLPARPVARGAHCIPRESAE